MQIFVTFNNMILIFEIKARINFAMQLFDELNL